MQDAEKSSQGKPEKGGAGISQAELDALLKAGPAAANQKPAQGVNEADIDALLAKATRTQSPKGAAKPGAAASEPPQPATAAEKPGVGMLMDVGLNIRVELGRRKMFIEDILKLTKGSVVELDKLAGEPLDILVNDKLIARGEVLVLNDNLCVRITNILSAGENKE